MCTSESHDLLFSPTYSETNFSRTKPCCHHKRVMIWYASSIIWKSPHEQSSPIYFCQCFFVVRKWPRSIKWNYSIIRKMNRLKNSTNFVKECIPKLENIMQKVWLKTWVAFVAFYTSFGWKSNHKIEQQDSGLMCRL